MLCSPLFTVMIIKAIVGEWLKSTKQLKLFFYVKLVIFEKIFCLDEFFVVLVTQSSKRKHTSYELN